MIPIVSWAFTFHNNIIRRRPSARKLLAKTRFAFPVKPSGSRQPLPGPARCGSNVLIWFFKQFVYLPFWKRTGAGRHLMTSARFVSTFLASLRGQVVATRRMRRGVASQAGKTRSVPYFASGLNSPSRFPDRDHVDFHERALGKCGDFHA